MWSKIELQGLSIAQSRQDEIREGAFKRTGVQEVARIVRSWREAVEHIDF